MKFTLFGTLATAVFLVPALAWGAFNDVTLTTDTILSVGGATVSVTGTSAVVESIVVDTNAFSLTLLPSSSVTVTSQNKVELNASNESHTTAYSCDSITLTGSGASVTITITPDTTDTCSAGGSGGGGGSGGSKGKTTTPTTPTPGVPVAPTKTSLASVSAVFTTNLTLGSASEDVKRLQTLLASKSDLYPEGTVSGYYGKLTQAAVGRFQTTYGIAKTGESGLGVFGPRTRAKFQEVFGGVGSVSTPTVSVPVNPTGLFTRTLQTGSVGEDVRSLQKLLNRDIDTRIASSGPGAEGEETTTFGTLTMNAVQKFQLKYGIAREGDPGYGTVGPKTRAKLAEVAN